MFLGLEPILTLRACLFSFVQYDFQPHSFTSPSRPSLHLPSNPLSSTSCNGFASLRLSHQASAYWRLRYVYSLLSTAGNEGDEQRAGGGRTHRPTFHFPSPLLTSFSLFTTRIVFLQVSESLACSFDSATTLGLLLSSPPSVSTSRFVVLESQVLPSIH